MEDLPTTIDQIPPEYSTPPVAAPPVAAPHPINPLLERVRIPGETFRLPSRGLFYTKGELSPNVQDGEVHVYPMTAMDEIVMRSPDKLFSGDAVTEVFQRCVPEILNPRELLAKDIDFLLACVRKVSYGEVFELPFKHDCKDAKEHVYKIQMKTFIQNARAMDPTTVKQKYEIVLDNKQIVKLHPIKYADVITIMQSSNAKMTIEEQKESAMVTLVGIVEAVDEITDKEKIKEWLAIIPTKWAHQLSNVIDTSSDWGPEFNVKITCKDCKKRVTVAAPMNPLSFFM
jgi:hypothetical protein